MDLSRLKIFVFLFILGSICFNTSWAFGLLSLDDDFHRESLSGSIEGFGASAQQLILPEDDLDSSHEQTDDGLRICTDAKLGVRFLCDPDWEIETDDNVLLVIIKENPDFLMTIIRSPTTPASLHNLMLADLKEIGNYESGFSVLRTTLNGRPVIETRGISAKDNDIHLHDYFFLENNKLYGILFSVKPFDAAATYEPAIKELITSFEFLPTNKID